MNKGLDNIIKKIKDLRPVLETEFSISRIGLFGSIVRGESKPDSDLDILVSFVEKPGLLEFARLKDFLSESLGYRVDLVLEEALKPAIGQRVLEEIVRL